MVEGPLVADVFLADGKSARVGHLDAHDKLAWQGAFITDRAMHALKVTDIKQYKIVRKSKPGLNCPTCVIQ
jgi:hypothetical protein